MISGTVHTAGTWPSMLDDSFISFCFKSNNAVKWFAMAKGTTARSVNT